MSCRCGRHNNDTENAPLAQLVEHLTLNQGVQGSSPWRCTRENRFWRHRSSGDGSFFVFILSDKLLYKAGNPCYIDIEIKETKTQRFKTQKTPGGNPGVFCS